MLSVPDLVSMLSDDLTPDEIVEALQDLVDGKDGPLGKIDLPRVADDALQLAIDSGLVRKIAEELAAPEKTWASRIAAVFCCKFTR